MEEIIFLVEESVEGGYTARGLGVSIYTDAETLDKIKNYSKRCSSLSL